MKGIVVAGIGTDIGKTFIAAILTEALEADYWKPVQSGKIDKIISQYIAAYDRSAMATHSFAKCMHPCKYILLQPEMIHQSPSLFSEYTGSMSFINN